MILSIDVGTTNLAICLFDENTKEIIEWDVDGIPSKSPLGIPVTLRNHLDNRPWTLQSDVILIERQPRKSERMIAVMLFLEAYFIIKCPNSKTLLWDARHKVPDVVGSGRQQYRLRKNTAITRCEEFLKTGPECNRVKWMDKWIKSKKKDDLADTVLQAISYTAPPPRLAQSRVKPNPDKITPRKPTENQKQTKYSVSNLAWFVKNEDLDKLKKDKRFMKDLKKYYATPEELKDKVLSS